MRARTAARTSTERRARTKLEQEGAGESEGESEGLAPAEIPTESESVHVAMGVRGLRERRTQDSPSRQGSAVCHL